MKTRNHGKRRLRNFTIILLMILAFCSGFFGHTLLNARAEEAQGDSLWDLAEQYRVGSGYSRTEYVEELKRMNGLKSEQIHSGEYLTVVYFAE